MYETDCADPPDNLYTLAGDGSGLHRLTDTTDDQTDPAWSPDGRSIAYVGADAAGLSCQGCPHTIWVMKADGADPRELTPPDQATYRYDGSPSWSPDGHELVFSRSSAFSAGVLYVVPAAGGPVRSLHLAGDIPAWGPHRIAYRSGNAIWTVEPNGADAHELATFPSNAEPPLSLAWSRDGRLAYVDQTPTRSVIEIAGHPAAHFSVPLSVLTLAWSPDGRSLLLTAFSDPVRSSPPELYSVGVDGAHLDRLTSYLGTYGGASWR